MVEIEKKFCSFGIWGSPGETSHVGVLLRFFDHLYPDLGANPFSHFLAQVFWKLGENLRF